MLFTLINVALSLAEGLPLLVTLRLCTCGCFSPGNKHLKYFRRKKKEKPAEAQIKPKSTILSTKDGT